MKYKVRFAVFGDPGFLTARIQGNDFFGKLLTLPAA